MCFINFCDPIHFEISDQALLTFHFLNKNSWTKYFIVINYAQQNLSIDDAHKFVISHAKKGPSKVGLILRFSKKFLFM